MLKFTNKNIKKKQFTLKSEVTDRFKIIFDILTGKVYEQLFH